MLSKGQGRTMGTYFTLINALAEDGRLDEVEELWTKLFSERLEGMPRRMFDKMISIYYKRDMYDQIFEVLSNPSHFAISCVCWNCSCFQLILSNPSATLLQG